MMKSLVVIILLSLAIPLCIRGQGYAPTQLNASAEVLEQVSCGGYADGAIAIDITGGQTPYRITWTHVPTSSVHHSTYFSSSTFLLDHLIAGDYVISVADADGRSSVQRLSIEEPLPLILETRVEQDATSHGLSNGAATVTVQGGAGGYSYLWNTKPNHTSASVSGLSSGMYVVEVTDRAGCRTAEAITIVNIETPGLQSPGIFQVPAGIDPAALRSRTHVYYIADDVISVRLPESMIEQPAIFFLMDISGRRVLTPPHYPGSPETTIDMHPLARGVYTLFMQQGGSSFAIQHVQRR